LCLSCFWYFIVLYCCFSEIEAGRFITVCGALLILLQVLTKFSIQEIFQHILKRIFQHILKRIFLVFIRVKEVLLKLLFLKVIRMTSLMCSFRVQWKHWSLKERLVLLTSLKKNAKKQHWKVAHCTVVYGWYANGTVHCFVVIS
jgi:hypothetical protein